MMLRGNGGREIFFSEGDRSVFFLLLQEGVERFGYRVHGFCLMPNHVHLLVQVGDVPLSKGMQNLSFRYTGWINRHQGRSGHLFQGRYKAVLVDADSYLLELVRYIHLNPVRGGMVTDPADYPWSSHRAYLGLESIPWLHTDWVLGQFARRLTTCRKRYAAFVGEGMEEGYRAEFHGGGEDARVLGDEAFLAQVVKAVSVSRPPELETIIDRVCTEYETSEAELTAPSRVRRLARARGLVGWLAMRTGAATLTEIAHRFHRDVATLSQTVRRLDLAAKQEPAVARELQVHLDALVQ